MKRMSPPKVSRTLLRTTGIMGKVVAAMEQFAKAASLLVPSGVMFTASFNPSTSS